MTPTPPLSPHPEKATGGGRGHTPLPWGFAGDDGESRTARIYQGAKCEGKLIAEIANGEPWIDALDEWEANAAFIVKSANCHDDLLGALKRIAEQKTLSELSAEGEDCEGDFEGAYDAIIELARAAIAKAEGGTP